MAGLAIFNTISVACAEEPVTLDQIVVTATRSDVSQSRAPASISVVTGEKIERGVQGRIGEALGSVPGVYMRGSAFDGSRPGNSVGTLNIRGIPGAARSLILVDGVPFNSPLTGTIDYALLPTVGLDRIEVAPGPFSSLYGSSALGGVINIITKAPTKRELTVTGTFGGLSPVTSRGAVSYRDLIGDGFGVAFDFNYSQSSGFADEAAVKAATATAPPAGTIVQPVTGVRQLPTSTGGTTYWLGDRGARPWQSYNGSARIYYDLNATTHLEAGVTYAQSYNGYSMPNSALLNAAGTPVYNGWVSFTNPQGALTRINLNDGSSANPFMNFVPGGENLVRTFTKLETQVDDTKIKADISYVYDNPWFNSPTGASVLSVSPGGLSISGPGTYTPGAAQRVLATLQAEKPINSWNTLTVGTQVQHDWFNRNVGDLSNAKDPDSLTGAVSYYSRGWTTTMSGYAQNKSDLTEKLSLYLGGRYDYWSTSGFTGQQATPVQATLPAFAIGYPERSATAFSPKASLVYLPIEELTLRASVGQAFRTPDLLQLYSRSQTTLTSFTDSAPGLKPERATSWETGFDWRVSATGTRIRATYFENYLRDFIYTQAVSATQNIRTNAGAAVVRGVEASVEQRINDQWSLSGGVTRNWSLMTSNSAVPADVGRELTFTPRIMASFGVNYLNGPWSASLSGRYVSKVFADDQNRDLATGIPNFYDAYFTMDAKATYEIKDGLKLSIIGKNLLNRQYYQFYLQPGRTIFAELSYRY